MQWVTESRNLCSMCIFLVNQSVNQSVSWSVRETCQSSDKLPKARKVSIVDVAADSRERAQILVILCGIIHFCLQFLDTLLHILPHRQRINDMARGLCKVQM